MYSMLCLGDSYTVGEGVSPDERFCSLAVKKLKQQNIFFDEPHVIAQTGWTTDELIQAIKANPPETLYDVVTLLIGVNNQYRRLSTDIFATEYRQLLDMAISFCKNGKKGVWCFSIPDWSVTPFVSQDKFGRDAQTICAEIEDFNNIIRSITLNLQISLVEITEISRKASGDASLLAADGLHPSAKMYDMWADLLYRELIKKFFN
ncbi:MAG: SGNH/GDSL hydrolase family protein [Chitinophagales bacterium]|nr:SGNH/GDSL hydrolase family protein [Chitinophagales bacterium]MDW8274400.1 SGNH/GDSL hydrolase family protein [Chitinophagales bacterium]